MSRRLQPQAYARVADAGVELIIWRQGSRKMVPVRIANPIWLCAQILECHDEATKRASVHPYAGEPVISEGG